jgi:hypothetical protein
VLLAWEIEMSFAKMEAVAEACAELNNVGLPNVHDLASALKELIRSCRALERNVGSIACPPESVMARAESFLACIEPCLAANI